MKNILLILLLSTCLGITAQESDCSFGIVLNSAQATVGESVTVDITTRQYNDISGLQYSHQWNPEYLQFEEVVYNNSLPVSSSNFNLLEEDTNAGILKFVFLDGFVASSLPDNSILYSLRFTYLQTGETVVNTSGENLAIEIVTSDLEILTDYYFIHSTISDNPNPPASFNHACITTESCSNSGSGSIDIDVSVSTPSVFTWESQSFVANTEDIENLNAGIYSLTVADQNNGQFYGDFYISANDSLSILLSVDNDECGGQADGAISALVWNGSGNYSYVWSNGETTAELDNLEAGTYSVTITDNIFGCFGVSSAVVENNGTFWVTHQSIETSCSDSNDGQIDLTVDGPDNYAPFTYLWSNGSTTEDLTGLTQGLYIVMITANNGCTYEYSIALNSTPFPIPASITDEGCENNSTGSISIDLSSDDYSFLWSTGETSSTINNLAVGDYELTVTQLSSNCTNTADYTIESTEFTAVFNTSCHPNPQLNVVPWPQSNAPFIYQWSNGEITVSNHTSQLDVTENGNYSVTVTNSAGCSYVLDNMIIDCNIETIDLALSPHSSQADNGETFCLDINVNDFTDQLGCQFTIGWDESLLAFNRLENFGLNSLDNGDFGFNLIDDGYLTTAWLTDDLTNGESLPSGATLFSICFDVISTVDVVTNVHFTEFPTAIEMINLEIGIENINTQNAQVQINENVGAGGGLHLIVDDVLAYQNDLICVPVTSSGFSDILGLQFGLAWDPTELEFNSIQNIEIPDINLGTTFNSIDENLSEGILRFLWLSNTFEGIYLPAGESLFEVCYIAIGSVGNHPIQFTQEPVSTEAINEDLEEIESSSTNGSIQILSDLTDELVSLGIASAAINPGEAVCLPIYAIEMEQILAMQFSINWDQDLINFESIDFLDNPVGLSSSNYNVEAADGIASFAWSEPNLNGISLAQGAVLFEMCFTANQQEGTAAVIFSNQPTPFEFIRESESLGFLPVNGEVVISDDGLVWPGDTDLSTSVDHFDLLNIGIAYGAQGPVREGASLTWISQHAEPWTNTTPFSEVDYRHIDADGNGIINELDISALEQNWGEITDGFNEEYGDFRELNLITAPFYVLSDTVEADTQVFLPIILGTDATTVEDAYGIAFTIYYDQQLVRPGSAQVIFDGWMGSEGENLIGIYRDNHSAGKIDIALVRTDGQNVSGEGQIASFGIIMEDVIFRDLVDAELLLRIENVRLINVSEDILPTSPRESIVLVEGLTNNQDIVTLEALSIHPNPANDQFTITHPNIELKKVRLYDTNGQLISNWTLTNNQADINELVAGVYWIEFETDKGLSYRKLVKF